jgi:hypothetical protein
LPYTLTLAENSRRIARTETTGVCRIALLRANAIDAIRIQHISQHHDTFELMNFRPVDDLQDIEMVLTNAFESEMQGMVRAEVRNLKGFYEVFERLFFSPIGIGVPQHLSGQHSQKVILLCNGPDAKFTGASLFDHILDLHLAGRISAVFRMT